MSRYLLFVIQLLAYSALRPLERQFILNRIEKKRKRKDKESHFTKRERRAEVSRKCCPLFSGSDSRRRRRRLGRRSIVRYFTDVLSRTTGEREDERAAPVTGCAADPSQVPAKQAVRRRTHDARSRSQPKTKPNKQPRTRDLQHPTNTAITKARAREEQSAKRLTPVSGGVARTGKVCIGGTKNAAQRVLPPPPAPLERPCEQADRVAVGCALVGRLSQVAPYNAVVRLATKRDDVRLILRGLSRQPVLHAGDNGRGEIQVVHELALPCNGMFRA